MTTITKENRRKFPLRLEDRDEWDVVKALNRYLLSQNYALVRANGKSWYGDTAAFSPDKKQVSVYEVKNERARHTEVRGAFGQALDGFIDGYISFIVIPERCLLSAQRFRAFFPVGVITYVVNDSITEFIFTTQWEGTIPSQVKEVAKGKEGCKWLRKEDVEERQ